MKTHLGSALLALSLFCAHCVLGADGQWRVESLKLKSNEDTRRGDFTAIVVSASGGERVELSSRIPLEKIDDSFITGDKLVLLGQAYKPQAVVIFDIKLRRPIDWFACYSPERVSERWIAYVEFYFPNISGGEPTDVVLVYDLNKSPLENRLESEPEINLPPDRWTNVPTHVGVPVYPEWNAIHRSYVNVVRDASDARSVLGQGGYALIDNGKLAFVATDSAESISGRADYLVVADLDRPVVRRVDIPRSALKGPGKNRKFTRVTKIEAVSPRAVRLYLPQSEYAAGSIVVEVPK